LGLSEKLNPADFLLRNDGVCRLNPQIARGGDQIPLPSPRFPQDATGCSYRSG
jgi:hypothetical protein